MEAQPPTRGGPDLAALSLEELLELRIDSVSSASRFLQKVTEAPASVTIVTAEDIERYGWRTLADVLRSVRGFYVTDDRAWAYVGTRGFLRPGDYNTRLLLLVDGHRLNDNLYDQALVQEDFALDLTEIERIEIVRGPSSSLYGSSAFFGVINVVTAPVRPGERPEMILDAGTMDAAAARFRAARTFASGTTASLSASFERIAGDSQFYDAAFDSPSTNNGFAVDLDTVRRAHAFARIDHKQFSLRTGFNERRKAYPTAAFGTAFNDPDAWVRDRRLFVDGSWERALGEWTTRVRAAYDAYRYAGSYPYDSDGDAATASDPSGEGGTGDWLTGEAHAARAISAHRLAGGVEYRGNVRQRQFSYLTTPEEPTWEDSRRSGAFATYVQDEFRLHRSLLLNGGLRYDRYGSGDAAVKPRIAAIFEPSRRTAFKAIYGTAFRAPNVFERFYASEDGYTSAPNLEPENMRTLEGVAETYLGSTLRLTGSLFRYDIRQLIALRQDADGLLSYDNVDRSRATGAEAEAEVKTAAGIHARLSYTYSRVRDNGTPSRPVNSPAHVTQALVSTPVFGRATLGLDVRALSSRSTRQDAVLPAHVVPNVTVSAPLLHGRLHATLVVSNLFDATVSDPVDDGYLQDAIVQHGRAARIRVRWQF